MSPTEFWNLPPGQVWWIIQDNMPEDLKRPSDMAEVRRMVKQAKAKEQNG